MKEYNKVEVKDNMKVQNNSDSEEVVQVKAEKKQLQKVIDVKPKKVKRNLLSRLITGVMGPEGLPGIGAYVNEEIIKPAVKNIIYDSLTSGLSRALFNDSRPPRGGYPRGNAAYRPNTNYSGRYAGPSNEPEPKIIRTVRNVVEDYTIDDRHNASNVLVSLVEYAERYNSVSVADYYEMIGVAPKHTDNDYGWTYDTISRATVIPVRGGYMIKLPPVEVI